jgi:small subunit ribosomal protein S6
MQNMAFYESTFIVRQDASAPDVAKLTETFSNIITENGGKVLKSENWGLKNLAYIIKKNRKGHYVMLVLDAPDKAVKEMERRMKLSEDVIRHLILRIESFDNKDSIMLASSEEGKLEGIL